MKKPELVLTPHTGRFIGTCSSCPESVFRAKIEIYDENYFKRAFALHFKIVHLCANASQAAARIVREATEGRS